jgi:drug/metabolite transporter (DMT)-like permease
MLVVLLALSGALAYGVADFVGGLLSRRTSAWAVAFAAALGAGVIATAFAPLLPGHAGSADLLWGLLSGVGSGVGTAFLYRGLAAGRMGVVAPISGVGAALVPVVVALALGERPGPLVWAGIVCALPGIWLVAREPGAAAAGPAAGVADGILAGVGFGTGFAALGMIDEGAGLLPLGLNQLAAAVTVIVLAVALRAAWFPRHVAAYTGLVPGLLGVVATGAFMLATQRGSLTVSAILTSLYPAFTILLAALLLRERILRAQALGLLLCGATVALVAVG